MPADPPSSQPLQLLRDDFRRHLEMFYGTLKLAPPYESVEKAIRTLTTRLHALPKEEHDRIASDPALKWEHFSHAFEASGLAKKHRGIISGLARNRAALDLPPEYDRWLKLFSS